MDSLLQLRILNKRFYSLAEAKAHIEKNYFSEDCMGVVETKQGMYQIIIKDL